MRRVFGGGLLVIMCLLAARTSAAQAGTWHNLAVPTAAFEIAGVSADDDRAQLLLRLIRVVHSVPSGHKSVDPLQRQLTALLGDLDTLLDAVARLPRSEVTLSLAAARETRESIRDVLDAAGLRLREHAGRYVAELDDGDAVARRQRLARAGIDSSAVAAKLNAGEVVRISPITTDVPLPLPPEIWTDVVFQRSIPARGLFSAIIADRNASLLYYGLCSLTLETREFLRSRPELLQWLYRERPGVLAAYGGSFRIVNGRLDVPRGESARPLWEAVVGEPLSNAVAFLKQVLGRDDGRLAYFYESIDLLDGPGQRFALGLASSDADVRADRLRALYRAFVEIEADWSQSSLPFVRPMYDTAMLLRIARVTPDGTLAGPAWRQLWRRAFDSMDLPDDPLRAVRDVGEDGVLDAAALAELVALAPARYRRERFEAFAFGQRVFGGTPAEQLGDVLVALRAFSRFPALMLIVERLGATAAPVYAAIARHALAIERIYEPDRQIPLHAQFQGALAILDRLVRTGRLEAPAVDALLLSLATIAPEGSGGYRGNVAAWVENKLLPAIGAGDGSSTGGAERRLTAALADGDSAGDRRFEWEGLSYEVSVTASETRRIEAIRSKQGGNTLDAVLAFHRDVAAIAGPAFTLDRVKPSVASLKTHAAQLVPAKPWPGLNQDQAPDVRRTLNRAIRDLNALEKRGDRARAGELAQPLLGAADYLLGEVLVSLAYAPVLGDPDDLLGGEADVAHRHDFGAGTGLSIEARKRTPWLRPRQSNGITVVGSILGLDLALAPNALRRLATDRVPELPRLTQNDRDVFTTSLVLMNPRHLSEAAAGAVAAGIRSGRRLVVEAGSDIARLDELAAAARMSASRRQLLTWTAAHDTARVSKLFSMTELLEIGDRAGARSGRDALGLTEEPLTGCYCSRFPSPGPWEVYSGRPGTGQLATRVPDLTLRVTELLDELKAPAVLLPWVLSLATQDFIDEVPTLYGDDWPAAVACARAVSRERVEDYIAALAASGPLRPASANRR